MGPPGDRGHHILTAIDCYSKFCLLFLLLDKRSATVAGLLGKHLFGVFGPPAVVRSDNGTEFQGAFASLCAAHGVR